MQKNQSALGRYCAFKASQWIAACCETLCWTRFSIWAERNHLRNISLWVSYKNISFR